MGGTKFAVPVATCVISDGGHGILRFNHFMQLSLIM